jgi:S1-C subfamily serine protease
MFFKQIAAVVSAIILSSSPCLHAQIRNSVPIVRPKLTQEGKDTYVAISEYFSGIGQKDNANYFKSMSEGGFGSGYLSLDASGRTIVVTARHVVTFADKAELEFQKEDGKSFKIADCPVIYIDDDIDFAVILIPSDKTAELGSDITPLSLSQAEVKEGLEVWSAGYPGLLNNPAWQFAKGNITNSRLIVEKFGSPESAIFIQHTAPIDPGNSGGPLLVGDQDVPLSWEVVGINTWVVKDRQSANFAVSVEMLKKAFERIPAVAESMTAEETVAARSKEFMDAINQPGWSRYLGDRFISDRIVAETGWKVYQEQINKVTQEDYRDWYSRLFSGRAADTIREFLFYEFYLILHSVRSPMEYVGISKNPGGESDGESYRVEMVSGKRRFFVDWVLEYGSWRVSAASLPYDILHGAAAIRSPSDPPRDAALTPWAFLTSFSIDAIPTLLGYYFKYGFGLGYTFGLAPWFTCGGSLALNYSSSLVVGTSQVVNTLLEVNAFSHFNLPIGNTGVFPYLTMGPSVGAKLRSGNSSDLGFSAALQGGLGVQICSPDRASAGVEVVGRFGLDDVLLRIQSIYMRVYFTF